MRNLQGVMNPFFDLEGPREQPQIAPAAMAGGYLNPATQTLELTGRSMAAASGGGLRGAVVPHATPGGLPEGFDPNNLSSLQIVIDPHLHGEQGCVVELGTLTNESLKIATRAGQDAAARKGATGIGRGRYGGALAYHMLAANGGATESDYRPQSDDAAIARPVNPQAVREPYPQNGTIQVQTSQPVSPFVSSSPVYPVPTQAGQPWLQAPPPSQTAPSWPQQVWTMPPVVLPPVTVQPTATPAQQPISSPPVAAAPVPVYFDLPGFGRHEAYYSVVSYESGYLILIWQIGASFPKYFPPKTITEPFQAHVPSLQRSFTVYATGVEYPVPGAWHCLLTVDESQS